MRVYLDNAASTPMNAEVFEAMVPYLKEQYGNPSSVHSHGRILRAVIEESRKTIAGLLGAAPSEIIFTSGGTEADNHALRCGVLHPDINTIISSPIEHHAVTHTIESIQAANRNLSVIWLRPDELGHINLDELEAALHTAGKGHALISLMHANNEIGTMLDLNAVNNLVCDYQAIWHSDTVQTIGHYPHNFNAVQGLHYATGAAHKFYGPKGIGFLYRRSDCKTNQHPFITGGGQERNMRAGTENVAGIVGMAKALQIAVNNNEKYHTHLSGLKSYFRNRLIQHFPGVMFNGEQDDNRALATVLNVSFPLNDTESLLLLNLDIRQISASGGSACSSGAVKGSHVLHALGLPPERIASAIRFSFGVQNTIQELDYVIETLKQLVPVTV